MYVPKTKAYKENMINRNRIVKRTLLAALASKVAILVKILPWTSFDLDIAMNFEASLSALLVLCSFHLYDITWGYLIYHWIY